MRHHILAAALVVPAALAFLAAPAEAATLADFVGSTPLAEVTEAGQDGDVDGERKRKCKGKKGRKNGEARTGDAGELRDGKKRKKRRGKRGRRGKRKGQNQGDGSGTE